MLLANSRLQLVSFGSIGSYCKFKKRLRSSPSNCHTNKRLSIFETHFKTNIVMFCFFLTTIGWWAWTCFLSAVYAASPSGPYAINGSFLHYWGRDPAWWATCFITLGLLGMIQIVTRISIRTLKIVGKWNFPPWKKGGRHEENVEELDLELWQEMEQDKVMKARMERLAKDEEYDELEDDLFIEGMVAR